MFKDIYERYLKGPKKPKGDLIQLMHMFDRIHSGVRYIANHPDYEPVYMPRSTFIQNPKTESGKPRFNIMYGFLVEQYKLPKDIPLNWGQAYHIDNAELQKMLYYAEAVPTCHTSPNRINNLFMDFNFTLPDYEARRWETISANREIWHMNKIVKEIEIRLNQIIYAIGEKMESDIKLDNWRTSVGDRK